MKKLQIKRVWIEHKHDESPDTSHFGAFNDTATEGAIIRIGQHSGKLADTVPPIEWPSSGREYRFFVPAMSGDETGNPNSPFEDWERMEALNDGQWSYIGIIAKAELWNPETHTVQIIHSGGVWGIESDAGAAYHGEIALDELASLKTELQSLGLGDRAIAYAFARIDREPVLR